MTDPKPAVAGLRIEIQGQVQGVGFRPWVYTLAVAAGIRGRVWNHAAGVTVEAFGDPDRLRAFAAQLANPAAPAARVTTIQSTPIAVEVVDGFRVEDSRADGVRSVSIPPDWATCPACLRELGDRTDRRHHYAFINCTQCGPRYTICRDVPYDRPQTTMAGFVMCAACRREYENPRARRFHAQPNACPACGPRLTLTDARGHPVDGVPVAQAAARLRQGDVVAVKGLGGFHLACDATSSEAVDRLRRRKQRDEKPFAVMVRDVDAAARLAHLSEVERTVLATGERPIVLVVRRPGTALAAAIAPGNPWLGVMLPYTPLHALLLDATDRPLVMTSGNLSDEPMACDNADAVHRLAGLADYFLLHDRDIANRCDDSVARVIDGRAVLLRRARGYVPSRLQLPHALAQPVLACGAHLKNAFCVADGDAAWMGPHIGDLETDEACRAFEESVERFQRFVGIAPTVVAHDLHPDYFTTQYARGRTGLTAVGVQHHHAHVAACMAEHGLEGAVIGLAWDGTGYGPDGTAWGGEVLVATYAACERIATFRPLPLAGGDQAIRQVWRTALVLLDASFDGAPPLDRLPLFAAIDPRAIAQVRQMVAAGVNCPAAHGVGRLFDAFGAVALGKADARYEGQIAAEFAGIQDPAETRPYPWRFEAGIVPAVDLRAALRQAVDDLLAGRAAATVAGRFHATLIAVGEALVHLAERRAGRLPIVLSGGCFQNARLVEGLRRCLTPGRDVYTHERVPPGDGGIALGQALVADARLRCGG